MAPSISRREGIRFLPKPLTEPTNTVVLTSPEGRFVDIRILSSGTSWAVESREDNLPATRIDWAFAGTSTSTPIVTLTTDSTGKIAHAKWTHWVDSRHRDAEAVSDEGDMFALEDGRTLERGSMADPETGLVGEYEEVWRDEPITETDRDVIGKGRAEAEGATAGGEREADPPRCTVLTLRKEEKEARGMVIRLGQFCQGILRVGEHFTLERWLWRAEGGWKRQVRIGDFFLPCGVVCDGKAGGMGGKVEYGEFEWVIVEDVEA